MDARRASGAVAAVVTDMNEFTQDEVLYFAGCSRGDHSDLEGVHLMCSLDSCDRPAKCRGMCKKHYEEWLASADPSEKMTPKAAYDPDFIVEKYRAGWTLTEIAAHYGRARRTLGDYIKIRPELYAEIQKIKASKKLAPEEADRRNRESRRRWRLRNPDKVREINRRWADNRSDNAKRAANARIRKERPRPVLQDPEGRVEYIDVLKQDPCCYCGASPVSTIDHIEPVSKGGPDDWWNLTAACLPCNQAKKTKSVLEFLLWRREHEEVVA